MEGDRLLAFVYGDLSVAFTHIAPVGISHFPRTVHYASHDCYHHAFQVCGAFLDLIEGLLKIVHRASASRAGYVFRSVESASGSLHQFVCEIFCKFCIVNHMPLPVFSEVRSS